MSFSILKELMNANPHTEISEVDRGNFLAPTPVYKVGTAAKFKLKNFSVPKVINFMGVQEVPHTMNPEFDTNEILGAASVEQKMFALNPFIRQWKVTAFHELGHLFMNHKANFFDDLFSSDPYLIRETEAEVFSFICAKELRLKEDTTRVFRTLNFYGSYMELTEEWYNEINEKAQEFLAIGG